MQHVELLYRVVQKVSAANICAYLSQMLTDSEMFSPAHSVKKRLSIASLHYLVKSTYAKFINIWLRYEQEFGA